jgi:hypothetical protein
MRVVRVDERMSFTTGNQPAVSRVSSDARDRKGGCKTQPEERFGKPCVHGARNNQHDEVVHDLHDRDRQRVSGQREAEGTPETDPGSEQGEDRESIACGERKADGQGDRGRVSPKPRAVPMTIPATSPMAHPVRQ